MSYSRGSSPPRDEPGSLCLLSALAGGLFMGRFTWEAHIYRQSVLNKNEGGKSLIIPARNSLLFPQMSHLKRETPASLIHPHKHFNLIIGDAI